MKVVILIEQNQVPLWSMKALKQSAIHFQEILVLNVENKHSKKIQLRFFCYYVLNILMMKNNLNKKVNFDLGNSFSKKIRYINFNSKIKKNWEFFPEKIISYININNYDLMIKFGMGLLTIPKNLNLRYGVLSYHHGDPKSYRGRPAGFYEILNSEKKMGVIIQRINNKLDGGVVVGKIFSPIYNFSYKKTLYTAYCNSIPLLSKSIINIKKNQLPKSETEGRIYRLPKNILVLKFIKKLFNNLLNRLFDIFFKEKIWDISLVRGDFKYLKTYKLNDKPKIISKNNYKFNADPFFLDKKTILFEGLNKYSKKGEIIINDGFKNKKLLGDSKNHFSYTCFFKIGNENYLLPEMSSSEVQKIYKIENAEIKDSQELDSFKSIKLIDPTYFFHDEVHYIFGGKRETANYMLHLWLCEGNIFKEGFIEHPLSPIVINPFGSRMAGNILIYKNMMLRFGQNNTSKYGDGIVIHKINLLNKYDYQEEIIDSISFENHGGPHTINSLNGDTIFDYYEEKVNPLAFFSKIVNRI